MPLVGFTCGFRGLSRQVHVEVDHQKASRLLSKDGPQGECRVCYQVIGQGPGRCDCRVEEVKEVQAPTRRA